MQIVIPGQDNRLYCDLVAKADGEPIAVGTVAFYLLCQSGDNIGKWWKASTSTWETTQQSAGAGIFLSGSTWYVTVDEDAWETDGQYQVMAMDSGDLAIAYSEEVVCSSLDGQVVLGGEAIERVVSVGDMKTHLHIDSTVEAEDESLGAMIDAATAWCESFQHRKYLTQTVVERFDAFPVRLRPVWSPLIAVTSIAYTDTAGVSQTLSSALYTVDTTTVPGRIVPAYGQRWPATQGHIDAVTLTYTAGYGEASAVPDRVKQAIKLLVGHWYANREDSQTDPMHQIPIGVESLLWQERLIRV